MSVKTNAVFFTLCISTMAAMIGVGILLPILPVFAKDLGASGFMTGIIISSFAVTMAAFNPVMGWISDHIGYKRLIVLGLAIHIPVALLYTVATAPVHLILIRLCEGMLCAMVEAIAMAYAGSIAPPDKEGSYMGIFNTFVLLGFGVGPLLGGVLTEAFSLNMPFYAMAAFLSVALVLVIWLVPAHNPRQHQAVLDDLGGNTVSRMLSSDIMKGMLIFSLILAIGQSGLMGFLPYVAQREHMSSSQTGILSSVLLLCAGLLQTPFGYLANRANKLVLVITGILMIALILLFVPLCSGFWTMMLLCIIGGVGSAVCSPAAMAIIVRSAKDMGLGLALGLFNLAMGLGMIIGPVCAGFIMDNFGLNQIFYSCSALFIIAVMFIYIYTKDTGDL